MTHRELLRTRALLRRLIEHEESVIDSCKCPGEEPANSKDPTIRESLEFIREANWLIDGVRRDLNKNK